MKPLCTITTDDPTELGALMRLLSDRYIGEQGRRLELSYGLTGVHVSIGERSNVVREWLVDPIYLRPDLGPAPTAPELAEDYTQLWGDADESTPDEIAEMDDHVAQREADALSETLPEDDAPEDPLPPATDLDDPTICPVCSAKATSKKARTEHLRTQHWPRIADVYRRHGRTGLVDHFDVSEGTASNWGQQLKAQQTSRPITTTPRTTEADEVPKPVFPDAGPIARLPIDQEAARNGAANAL